MKIFKKKIIFTSMFLALILCFSFLLPSFINSQNNIFTRDINANEIGALSYEEKVNQLLNTFDNYSIDNNDTQILFEGYTDISNFNFSGIQYLSTNAEITIKKYRTNLDIENEKFEIITDYIQDNVIVYTETLETTPYYDEYSDDYYIAMPDGTNVSLSESLSQNSFNECSFTLAAIGIALTAKEVAVLLTAVAIVAAPVIVEVVNVVVKTIVSWVKSFWSWFTSLWTAKTTTVVTTTITAKLSYTISISNTKIDATPYDKTMKFESNRYYIAIADTDDGLLYVSPVAISNISALAVLTGSTFVKSAHKGSNNSFVISLYTLTNESAVLIATEAGTFLGSPGAIHHFATKPGYFNHYHPGITYTSFSHPHVFYGTPKI
ncbi:MAG: hypothetical protein EOM55_02915 [Clostridia bacterium]|nr:hypothetical protein [Clostridia bacterium]